MSAPTVPAGRHRAEVRVAQLVSALRSAGGTAAICRSCHTAVPGLCGVSLSITLTDGRRLLVGAVGGHSDRIEDLQTSLGEGPDGATWASRAPVLAPDLAGDAATALWPRFAASAMASGVHAIFAFPVLVGRTPQAVLGLYRDSTGPLADAGYRSAADHAAAAGTLLLDDARADSDDDPGATLADDAALVQQATGMVMARLGVGAIDALHHLRAHAHDEGQPVTDVAHDLVSGTVRFPA